MHNFEPVVFLSFFALLGGLLYLGSILYLKKGWQGLINQRSVSRSGIEALTVIVPMRNEEAKIKACLDSILAQDYAASIKLIVVDDFSTDNSAEIVRAIDDSRIELIELSSILDPRRASLPNKKQALLEGALRADSDWLLFTDADTAHEPSWAKSMMDSRREDGLIVIGPIGLNPTSGFFGKFLELDQFSLTAIGMSSIQLGWPSMANGANLLVSRDFVLQDKFEGNQHMPTGDDYYLLSKAWEMDPAKVSVSLNLNSWVRTDAPLSFSEFLNQRRRWLSKSTAFGGMKLTAWLVTVYLWVFLLVLLLFLNPWLSMGLILFKSLADMLFLTSVLSYVKRSDLLFLVPLVQPIYLLYVLWAGPAGLRGTYNWKGRIVKPVKAKA